MLPVFTYFLSNKMWGVENVSLQVLVTAFKLALIPSNHVYIRSKYILILLQHILLLRKSVKSGASGSSTRVIDETRIRQFTELTDSCSLSNVLGNYGQTYLSNTWARTKFYKKGTKKTTLDQKIYFKCLNSSTWFGFFSLRRHQHGLWVGNSDFNRWNKVYSVFTNEEALHIAISVDETTIEEHRPALSLSVRLIVVIPFFSIRFQCCTWK